MHLDDELNFTQGIRVELTRNGLWVEVRRPDGGTDREFIPGSRLRRFAAHGVPAD
jgi:hypothetical protein